jgi:hypothetical protein
LLKSRLIFFLAAGVFWRAAAQEQPQAPPMDHSHMPGMNHGNMPGMQHEMSEAAKLLMRQASGTSLNPESWPMPMLMLRRGAWNTMFMMNAFVVNTQQSGPRGGDKFYSPNWFMASAGREVGRGSMLIDVMLSLDPATITQRRYPELFQTGETAFGRPIVDGQHPHDFIMAIGFHYARPLGEKTLIQAYFAPVGDPALGPVAFPHRASAMELPQAPLGHHWQDSTHIANEVVTVGIKHNILQLEASGFYGSEPNENRWNIDSGPINSWSTRFSVMPNPNWIAQVSVGRLRQPETFEPGDVVRATASVEYVKPLAGGGAWATSVIWGRNHKTATHANTNSYLVETVLPVRSRNFLTGRIELVDKDELFHGPAEGTYRIAAYTVGYTRDIPLVSYLQTGVGANFTTYTVPGAIQQFYGRHPVAVNMYLRVRLKAK